MELTDSDRYNPIDGWTPYSWGDFFQNAKARARARRDKDISEEKDRLKEQNEKQRKEIELLRKMLEGKLN